MNRTNVAPKVRGLEHLNAQILLDLAHDFRSVVELEMCILWHLSANLDVLYILSTVSSLLKTHLCMLIFTRLYATLFLSCHFVRLGWDGLPYSDVHSRSHSPRS